MPLRTPSAAHPFALTVRDRGPARSRVVRAVAGSAAGLGATRRGSFLVLVVGTLALMSVFAIVYVAIGRADVGTSTGLRRNAVRDDIPEQAADYIAKIIGDDALASSIDGSWTDKDGKKTPLRRRESTDYPSTNWSVTSINNGNNTELDFNPTGTAPDTTKVLGPTSDAQGPSDPWLASTVPAYLDFDGKGPTDPSKPYLDLKDWAQISNVAPDGAFVNEYNLRGNFSATPAQMRQKLSLLDEKGKPVPTTDFGDALSLTAGAVKFPAQTTMRQRAAFRIAKDVTNAIDSPDYALYQWADADGDGFLDSRWYELVDARNVQKPISYLESSGRLRYFFATRIVDLSGLVNVSTALDLTAKPPAAADAAKHPLGSSPADVDLRRLLTGKDAEEQYGLTYSDLDAPRKADGQLDGDKTRTDNYTNYGKYALNIGTFGYGSLIGSTATTKNGPLYTGLVPSAPAAQTSGPPAVSAWLDRSTLFTQRTSNDKSIKVYDTTDVTNAYRMAALFTPNDLLDLLAFRGVNNPDITSSLEQIFDGQYWTGAGVNSTTRYGAMRSNRGLAVERGQRDANKNDGVADPSAMAWSVLDVRQDLTTLSGTRLFRPSRIQAPDAPLTDAELKQAVGTDASSLYRAYASALVPFAATQNAWPKTSGGGTDFAKNKYQHYGYTTPELGILLSAHLSANLAKAADPGAPSVYTVLMDEEQRDKGTIKLNGDFGDQNNRKNPKDIGSRNNPWAWWVDGQQLDLGNNAISPTNTDAYKNAKLASPLADSTNNDAAVFPAMNVYAIEPQPFISAVGCYYIYTDYNDDESTDIGPDADLNIMGDVNEDAFKNHDLVAQVLAFQLTNPFDTAVTLGSIPQVGSTVLEDRFDYYIEYAGRYFKLAPLDRRTGKVLPGGVSLAPRESRVFFATCASIRDIESNIGAKAGTGLGSSNRFSGWVDQQMTVGISGTGPAPVWVGQFDPTTGTNLASGAFTNLFEKIGTYSPSPTDQQVRLWKALRVQSRDAAGAEPAMQGETPFPKDATKAVPLPPQFLENDQLVDRFKLKSGTGAGATVTLNCKLADGQNDIAGAVAKDHKEPEFNYSISLASVIRRAKDTLVGDGSGKIGLENGVPAFMIERKYASKQNDSLNTDENPDNYKTGTGLVDANFSPTDRRGDQKLGALFLKQQKQNVFDAGANNNWLDLSPGLWSGNEISGDYASVSGGGFAFADRRADVMVKVEKDGLRVGDLLLPLALGPEYDPSEPDFDLRYTTLSEALALAVGSDRLSSDPRKSSKNDSKKFRASPIYGNTDAKGFNRIFGGRITSDPSNNSPLAVVDRGHLALSKFPPFIDTNSNGVYDPGVDTPRGNGLPLALGVLDQFTTLPKDFVKIDRAVPGLVNLQTAPLTVLRMLPLLSPPDPTLIPGGWWFTAHGTSSDIAATLAAYRDKGTVDFRKPSAGTQAFVSFGDTTNVKPNNFQKLDGRANTSGIDGVREAPGLAGLADLLVVRDTTGGTAAPSNSNIDYLGEKAAVQYTDGVHTPADITAGAKTPDIRYWYQNKMVVANALSNVAAVRSDYFAVWFVVHGYAKSDTLKPDGSPLGANDPLVPSVARRFVMVVDRSEVTTKGQKPRIVLFKEVPL